MKILIVDDNAEDLAILYHYLKHFASQVLEASDGAEGLAIALRERPDLIIADALMPKVDGFELLREVRLSKELCETPFIFYSAVYTGSKDKELALALGANAFIAKPLDASEFQQQLRHLLKNLDRTRAGQQNILLEENETYLREYSRVVAARLERKVRELEATNLVLAESEKRYHLLFNSMRDVILIADPSRILIEANQPALRQMFGYETEEIVGRSAAMLYKTNEEFEKAGKDFFSLPNFQPAKIMEVEYRRKNGQPFTAEISAFKLIDAADKVIGNVAVVHDVTEQRKLESQFRQSQKMESIGTLAGGIAHDFNNILTAIIGYGYMALRKMPPTDAQRKTIERILESADRAAELTKGLLLFSRKQVLDRKVVDLNLTIKKAEELLKRIIGEDIDIRTDCQADTLLVLADEHQLEQVLMNLATNARDSMPQGGTLIVAAEAVQLNEDFIKAHGFITPGNYALITVSDSGKGMDEATRQHIFEPFFTTKETGKGTGLGLSVVYGTVKQHEGHISVYSEPNEGTTFRIYLPLSATAESAPCATEPEPPPAFGTETILLAEDDEAVRSTTTAILSDFGYKIIEAVDGEDALQKFAENQAVIDLLIFDLIMPKLNGNLAYDKIRADWPEVKALFFSGYAPDTLRQKIAADNHAALVSKPVSPLELLRKVREVLDATEPP